MAGIRTVLNLTPEAQRVLEENTTPRRRGEWISQVLTEYARQYGKQEPIPEDAGILEQINVRLQRIERIVGDPGRRK